MYVRELIFKVYIFLCVIVIAIQAISDSENGVVGLKDTTFDSESIKGNIRIKTDVTEASDIGFRQSGTCSTDADCHHLGKCVTKDGGKFCKCKEGTSGDFCATVDECVENPVRCGTGDDVACIFDIVEEKASCKCDNDSKTYVVDEERCMSPCNDHSDCRPHGDCMHEIGNSKFCACLLGTSGDFCEIIDECHNKDVDCGIDPNATCILDEKGNAYCKCRDVKQSFDYIKKVCKGKTCSADADCHHSGKCKSKDGGKFCKCKEGTSGDFCAIVDECVENPVRCGTGDDVACIFDIVEEKAACKCENHSKTYVVDEERCMFPCNDHSNCRPYGNCMHEIGESKFCACRLGTSGDFCEIIDECHNKDVDCGIDPNATCTLGKKGKAYCKCRDVKKQGFDYVEKVCKDCECGSKSLGCVYENGTKGCTCMSEYYSKEGRCEDCKCGSGSYGCTFENGKIMCECYGGYKQSRDQCQYCNCGPGSTNCEFKDGNRKCTCKEGYVSEPDDADCKEMCTSTNPCQNGGKCIQGICKCRKGTSGSFCQTVDDCANKCGSKWNNAICLYNISSEEAYCKCHNSKFIFDEYYTTCRECNCGSYGICKFEKGDKKCICRDLYAEKYGECTSCDCGRNGNCSFTYYQKNCHCNEGYQEYRKECKECDCGRNGKCSLDYDGNKICTCYSGYKEFQGTCKSCNCWYDSTCQFNIYGDAECICSEGYSMKSGRCTACNCGSGNNCTFSATGDKSCVCPQGSADKNGYCTACDCETSKANCSFGFLNKRCFCPEGYEEADREWISWEKYCKDIDECVRNSYICPYSTTECINKPGSYDCVCKKGYETRSGKSPKLEGCQDIDECKRGNPCAMDAVCVNTVGSFRCDCLHGYRRLMSSQPERNICHGATRPWRTASIVVGCLCGLIIAGLLIAVCRKCGK